MEARIQGPSVLRLLGISLSDVRVAEDVFDSRLRKVAREERGAPGGAAAESDLPADKIPRTFVGLEDWPAGTNLLCWECGFSFDGPPKFVPTYVEATPGGLEFGVSGNYCTFNCAERGIETRLAGKSEQLWRARDNLCLVYFIFTGRRVARIYPAPARTELLKYGGTLDEDAFWARLRALDPHAGLRDHTTMVVPERDRAPAVLEEIRADKHPGGSPVLRVVSDGGAPCGRGLFAVGPQSVWNVCGLEPPASAVAAGAKAAAASSAAAGPKVAAEAAAEEAAAGEVAAEAAAAAGAAAAEAAAGKAAAADATDSEDSLEAMLAELAEEPVGPAADPADLSAELDALLEELY